MADNSLTSSKDIVLSEEMIGNLLAHARKVMSHAYCPYSNFPVGAAVLASSGKIFTGCNVENASYGLTICAERSAIFAAVADGVTEIAAIAVVTNTESPSRPCGACRQVIAEFSRTDRPTTIICSGKSGETVIETIQDLLPQTFALL